MKRTGAVKLLQDTQVIFSGGYLEELKARLHLYILVKNACWSDEVADMNVFAHKGEDWLGERLVFHAGEDFSEAMLMMLSSTRSTKVLAQKLNNVWPPDIADAFCSTTGILDISTLV